jgi:uncharacterized protein (DUF305 family)
MQKESILYGIIGLLAGSLITIVVASSAVNNNNYGMMQMMGIRQMSSQNTAQGTVTSNIDRHFIEQMIPHHEDAITMANIALEKATHPEIKTLSQDIIKSQSDEIRKMKGWYKDWFGGDVPENTTIMGQHGMMQGNGMHMGMMGDETDIESLRNAANFDKAFIEEMIPHHQMAVMMANMLKNSTQREEMKKLAQDIITAQTKEINQMREWYDKWY